MESVEDQMLYVTFNQDASCFAVGTEKGFKIFNSFPFKDSFERSNNNPLDKKQFIFIQKRLFHVL